MKPGTVVSELSLSRTYGCSPTPVRDAVGHLRQEGLIVAESGSRRQIVAPLNVGDVRNLAEARAVIETGVLRLLLSNPGRILAKDLDRLAQLAKVTGGRDNVIASNRAFHVAIAALTRNERLVVAVGKALDDQERILHIGINTLPQSEMEGNHQVLVEAIRTGNLEQGIRELEQEAYGTCDRVLEFMVRQPPGSSGTIALTRPSSVA